MDEASRCDRIALIQKGEIMQIDTPNKILKGFKPILHGVKALDMYQLVQDLRTHSDCHSAHLFGEWIHFTTFVEINKHELKHFLEEKGNQQIQIEELNPVIEDSFMELMTQKEGNSHE